MKFTKSNLSILFILMDWLSAVIAWAVFYFARKLLVEDSVISVNESFYFGLILVPFFWLFLFTLQGSYIDVRRLHRMKMLGHTFFAVLFGSIILFFFLLLDDEIEQHTMFYKSYFLLFLIHFIIFLLVRFTFVSILVNRIHKRKIGFRTLIIGGNEKAVDVVHELTNLKKSSGQLLVGFVNLNGTDKLLEGTLPYFGKADENLEQIIREHEIEEVVIALESREHDKIKGLINRMSQSELRINILSDMYDILSGSVKMSNLFGVLLIVVNSEDMPVWQQVLKRIFDVLASLIAVIILTPIYLVLAIMVKFSSKGPIFFRQERIGKNGRPFKIIKFRTMYVNAEANGPQLSSSSDKRITPIGRVMRKLRLDELPQFLNVIWGDMSLVGPRPERQFFIDQIIQIEPQFIQLTKVRPGITSWGQVKYGYAENVNQMIQRMKYDMLYLKNRTLALDFKILLYTIIVIVKAKGK